MIGKKACFDKPPIYLAYLVAITMPFREPILNLVGISIRIADLTIMIWLSMWLICFHRKINMKVIKINKKVILFVLFILLSMLLAMFKGINKGSIDEIFRIIISIFAGISIMSVLDRKERISKFFKYWIIGSFLVAIYGLLNLFLKGFTISDFINIFNASVHDFYEFKFASSEFFGDPNNYASYLMISIGISYGLLKTDKYNCFKSRNTIKYIILTQIIALFTTLSRGAYVASLGVVLIWIYSNRDKIQKVMLGVIALVFVPIILGIIYILFSDDVSAMSRLDLWETAIRATIYNPIFGLGIGNFTQEFGNYLQGGALIYNPYTHNLFLKISSELGIVGIIMFVSIYLRPIKDALFGLGRNNIDIFVKCIILALCSFLIQGVTVEYFSSRHFWILTSIMLMLWQQDKHEIRKSVQRNGQFNLR